MNTGKRSKFLVSAICFGMAFLYIPIFLLIVYSFNKSKIVPVWG
ncbi:MAG: putrescine ABC transporter permease PotI, partial [Gammaproteobacteria bacterium]|nr:putrescine ABC transporter permease PotI [Gammaproteobacteria bacterium]